jgi:very-short-patch-repair endonuclease
MGWERVARQQHGVISRAQLREAGQSERVIDRLLTSGAISRQHPGVYLVRGAPATYRARLWAAVLATEGALGFATAAHLWGFVDNPADRIDVVIGREDRARVLGVRVHRIEMPVDAFQVLDGLPITSRPATLLDHIGRQPFNEACRLADRAIQRGVLEPADFGRRVKAQPGRTGNRMLRRLEVVTSDGAAAKSERMLHRLLTQAGLTGWTANFGIWHHGQLLGVADLAFIESRLAIEIDGWAFHIDGDRFQRDRTKQNDLAAIGWTVLRFTWADIVQRPRDTVARVRRQLSIMDS